MTSPSSLRESIEAIVAAAREDARGLECDDEHNWTLGDRRIQGVTELIGYWGKKSDQDWFTVDDSERGDEVHAAIANGIPAEYMTPERRGYRAAWDGWLDESGYVPIATEMPVLGPRDNYGRPLWAGRIDGVGILGDAMGVIDPKSHRSAIPQGALKSWALQLEAYSLALAYHAIRIQRPVPVRRVIVSLAPDGSHRAWPHDAPTYGWPGIVEYTRHCRGRRYGGKL